MYRPQFAYKTPEGCRDEDFVYYYDGSNTPQLNQNISGLTILNIPLTMQQDAPFYWRGIKVGMLEIDTGYVIPNVSVQFQDCYQNNLSDDMVPATQYAFPSNPVSFGSQLLTGPPFLLDPEIYCPPGGYILLFLQAPVLGDVSDSYFLNVSLYGVKRFKEDCV
jgi:hypothetical protein